MKIDQAWFDRKNEEFSAVGASKEFGEPSIDLEARNVDPEAFEANVTQIVDQIQDIDIPEALNEFATVIAGDDWRTEIIARAMFAMGFDFGYAAALEQDLELDDER